MFDLEASTAKWPLVQNNPLHLYINKVKDETIAVLQFLYSLANYICVM